MIRVFKEKKVDNNKINNIYKMSLDKECTGCRTCEKICPKHAINMKENEEGFLIPKIDKKKCINCGKCLNICPQLNNVDINIENQKAFAATLKNQEVLMKSSSGGVFSVFAEEVLKNGGVVMGCAFDDSYKCAKHIIATKKEELSKLRGSKYLQSSVGSIYYDVEKLLNDDIIVLFSGTPCQVAGLKSYLKQKKVNTEKLVAVDFICHGVPSPKVWHNYADELEREKNSKISYVSFRDKEKGWKQYALSIRFEDGSRFFEKAGENDYLRGFISDVYLRKSCHQCVVKGKMYYSDITLADFWGIEKNYPKWDDNIGVSLVVVHTDKGQQLLENVNDSLRTEEVTEEKALQFNKSYYISTKFNPVRAYFFKSFKKKGFKYAIKKYNGTHFQAKIRRKYINWMHRVLVLVRGRDK